MTDGKLCAVGGCNKLRYCAKNSKSSLCQNHRGRKSAHGDVNAPILERAARGEGCITKRGYKVYSWRIGQKKYEIREHRLVWLSHNGPIPEGHVIHHIDGDKLNNAIENLQCMSVSDHRKHHLGTLYA